LSVGEGTEGQKTQADQGQRHQLVQLHLLNLQWFLVLLLVAQVDEDAGLERSCSFIIALRALASHW
jgi:hypothetical protein